MKVRQLAKAFGRGLALVAVLPALASFRVRAAIIGGDRALEGSSQALAIIPGLVGQYMRRAFLSRVLCSCHHTAAISFGTVFSRVNSTIEENVYVGPYCDFGDVHLERDVMIAAGVRIPSGAYTHGIDAADVLMREQTGRPTIVRIGAGTWIGNNAVVMADVGRGTIVGAGAVVTRQLPDRVVAAGVPARIIRSRDPVTTP